MTDALERIKPKFSHGGRREGAGGRTQDVRKRFENKVYYALDGCWYWIGCTCKLGYGRFRMNGKTYLSTRISYMLHNGSMPPDDMDLCHECDNASCVNPHHLFLGTHSDNMKDMYKKRRRTGLGENNGRTKLTNNDVEMIRSGKYTIEELSKMLPIGYHGIRYILQRKTWNHI